MTIFRFAWRSIAVVRILEHKRPLQKPEPFGQHPCKLIRKSILRHPLGGFQDAKKHSGQGSLIRQQYLHGGDLHGRPRTRGSGAFMGIIDVACEIGGRRRQFSRDSRDMRRATRLPDNELMDGLLADAHASRQFGLRKSIGFQSLS